MFKIGIVSVVAVLCAAGCALPSDGGADSEPAEDDVGSAASALVNGAWVSSFPSNPVLSDGGPLGQIPVCRVLRSGGYHPGKWWSNQCYYEYNDTGWTSLSPSVPVGFLVDDGYRWVDLTTNNVPSNAVSGGPVPGGVTEVCEALVSGQYHPGKFWLNTCRIEYGGAGHVLEIPPGRGLDGSVTVRILVR
jgi:hypothetical protein